MLLPRCEAVGRVLAVDDALDLERGLSRCTASIAIGQIYLSCPLAAALLACRALDIGKLEELPARVREAAYFEHRARLAATMVELAIAGIGVGLSLANSIKCGGARRPESAVQMYQFGAF